MLLDLSAMDLTPMRGVVFVKPIETAETLPGGRVALLESTREKMVAQQAEIVSVGPPGVCDKPEECERSHPHPVDPKIVPGAWVLCAKWAYVGVRDKLFAVRHEDIIGVFTDAPKTAVTRSPQSARAGHPKP